MKDTLEEYFMGKQSNIYNVLPFCHTTPEDKLDSIIKSGLTTKKCDVYNEDLLYFFYGKSSYVVDKNHIVSINRKKPVGFVYLYDELKKHIKIRRLLPFDSGGFKYYGFGTGVDKEIFTIYGSHHENQIGNIIQLIYGSNKQYIEDEISKNNLIAESGHAAVAEIKNLYIDRLYEIDTGKQALTIEVQIAEIEENIEPHTILIPYSAFTVNESGEKILNSKITAVTQKFPNSKIIPYLESLRIKTKIIDGFQAEHMLREEVLNLSLGYA